MPYQRFLISFLVFLFFLSNQTFLSAQIISTVAGNGVQGSGGDGGLATSAQLFVPASIVIDAVGNKYIADTWNNKIRKVNRNGVISTFAGNGSGGYSGDGGNAIQAQLNGPNAVAIDLKGNVYISDGNNFCIRKVDTKGKITTIAGSGTLGLGDGGPATSAQLAYPTSIQLDSTGNLYIADWSDQRIRKVDTFGIITTIAGNGNAGFSGDGGLATAATINYPACLALDKNGNILFTDYQNSRIRKIDKNGIISTIAGNGTYSYTGDAGLAINAGLNSPYGIAIDANGNIFFSDQLNYCIRKIDVTGKIVTAVGDGNYGSSGDGGLAINASLENPYGLAIDAAGNLYIADHDNNRIRKVTYSNPLKITSFTPTTAATGSTVTITGKGFTGTFSVSFGAVNATGFSVLNDSIITAVVASGASGNISISNLDSTKTKAGFSYCIPVTPSISITSSATSVCEGTSVSFDASPVNGGSSPTYQWIKNGSNVIGAVSSTYSYIPSDADLVTCLMTANNACQTINSTSSNGITIGVSKNVTPTVSITPDANNICKGTSVLITAQTTNAGNNPNYNFLVNGISVQSGYGTTYSSSTFSDGDKVACVLTANNTCQTLPTATSSDVNLTVSNNLTPTVFIASSESQVCSGNNVIITATPLDAGSSPNYNFLVNGMSLQNGLSNSYSSNSFVDGDKITCVLTSSSKCQTIPTATSNLLTQNILLPTSSSTDATVCYNEVPYVWNGQQYGVTGSYLVHLTNAVGCDSAATLNLNVIYCAPTCVWNGANSANWGDATNWSNKLLPSASNNVVIPAISLRQPILNTSVQIAGLVLNGSLSLNGHECTINGAISGTGLIKSTANSILNKVGKSDTLNFDATANTIGTLRLNGGTITLGNALDIVTALEGTSGSILNTNNNLTLKSSASGTAYTSNLSGVTINGKVNIERYIPKGYAAFRDLGVCVSNAGTIAESWGQSLLNYTSYSYNASKNPAWNSVSANTVLQPYNGYRILVSGYKNPVIPTKTASFMNSDVTLSYSGSLLIGNQNIPLTAGVNKFSFISNPYPSQVDITKLSLSGLYQGYWYLSPTLVDSNYENYNYYGVNVGVSNIYAKTASQYLQPGQAFFVCSNSNTPSLTFTESAKDNANAQTSIFGITSPINRIATGLFSNGNNLDGAVVVFNNNFSSKLNNEDGLKINNQGENLTFNKSGADLCANAWSLPTVTDELPIHLYQLQSNKVYTLRLDASQFQVNGLSVYLKDKKTNNKTPLIGDSTVVSFTLASNRDTSYTNRYCIVFSPTTLPIADIVASASLISNNQVLINWSVKGEESIKSFVVEKSVDGSNYASIFNIDNNNIGKYYFIDDNAFEGSNYYRIKAIANNGKVIYSNTSKLITNNIPHTTINIIPNPVHEKLNVKLTNNLSNNYKLRILTLTGVEAFNKTKVTANNSTITLPVSNLAAGVYFLELTDAQGNKQLKKFVKD